jgi:protoheme IX farnesyltransferase
MDALAEQRSRAVRLGDLWALTKPRQTMLLLVTGVCTYTLSRGLPFNPLEGVWMVAGLLCAISGCTALNMLLDLDIDNKMIRTANRPLPSGALRPAEALLFGGLLSITGLVLSFALDLAFGLVVAAGFAIDLLIYTAWLKRRTPLSIVFGGISGGMPVLAGRVLGLGRVDGIGILLASSVLLWIPSHILTLATRYAADYERAGVPMWPNVYGPRATRLFIAMSNLTNTLVLMGTGLLLHIDRLALLILCATSLGIFTLSAWQLVAPTERRNWVLFKAASFYMLASSLLVTIGAIV